MTRRSVYRVFVLLLLSIVLQIPGVSAAAPPLDDALADAQSASIGGDYDGAIAKAQVVIAGSQDSLVQARGYLLIGYCNLHKKSLDAALTSFSKAANDYPDQKATACEAQIRTAYLLDKLGRFEPALAAYQKAAVDCADQNNQAATMLLRSAYCLDKLGRLSESKATFQKVIDLQAIDPGILTVARIRLVTTTFKEADQGTVSDADAYRVAQALAASCSGDPVAQAHIQTTVARRFLSQGKPLDSIRASRAGLKALSDMRPIGTDYAPFDMTTTYDALPSQEQTAWARVYLADLFLARPDASPAAKDEFARILTECSTMAGPCKECRYRMGEALASAGKVDEAIAALSEVTKAYATDRVVCGWAAYRIGDCFEKQGKTAEALKAWRDVLAKYPNMKALSTVATFRIFRYFSSVDDPASASSALTAIDSSYPPKVYAAAKGAQFRLLLMQGKSASAVAVGREAVANAAYDPGIVPGSYTKATIQLQLANCLAIQKDYSGAIAEAQKVGTMAGAQPTDVSAAALLVADCYRNSGKLAEAVAAYQKVVTDWPNHKGHVALAKFGKALSLYESKQLAEAKAEFTSFLSNCALEADGESIDRAESYLAELAE